jgi:predicted transglutaminase-like cysteine proteinase
MFLHRWPAILPAGHSVQRLVDLYPVGSTNELNPCPLAVFEISVTMVTSQMLGRGTAMDYFKIFSYKFLNQAFLSSVFSTALLSFTVTPALAASFIVAGSLTSKPYGHVAYCKANPSECRAGLALKASAVRPEQTAGAKWTTLQKINSSVNKSIKPVSDLESSGVEDLWSASVKRGDCEDYALTKRRRLVSAGFKPSNLRLAMTRTSAGTAHVVLVVRSDKGDLVLDNLKPDIMPWNQTGLHFIKIQANGGSSQWVSIAG